MLSRGFGGVLMGDIGGRVGGGAGGRIGEEGGGVGDEEGEEVGVEEGGGLGEGEGGWVGGGVFVLAVICCVIVSCMSLSKDISIVDMLECVFCCERVSADFISLSKVSSTRCCDIRLHVTCMSRFTKSLMISLRSVLVSVMMVSVSVGGVVSVVCCVCVCWSLG